MFPMFPMHPAEAALELRTAAALIEEQCDTRRRLSARWLASWTGRHRQQFDADLARSTATGLELAELLRVAAARLESRVLD